jgi:hypothetical protein
LETRARNCGVLVSGVGATLAVLGDDRLSDTHASQYGDIYHSGSSGFGGNADSAEDANLGCVLGVVNSVFGLFLTEGKQT